METEWIRYDVSRHYDTVMLETESDGGARSSCSTLLRVIGLLS